MPKYPIRSLTPVKGWPELKCARCAKPFWVIPSQVKYLKTCSPECHHPPPLETFMAKVEKQPNGCWLYKGAPGASGYGNVKANGKQYRAARLAWELQKGEIQDGLFVLHDCDTPLCVNLDHLYLGTVIENTDDRMKRGRQKNGGKGEQCNFALLSEAQALAIKQAKGTQTAYELALKFNVKPSTVWNIWAGRTWKHLS